LLAVGFAPDEKGDFLVLSEEADREVLAQTRQKLEIAHAAY